MSYFNDLNKEPWRFDLLELMRRVERTLAKPVVSHADVLRGGAQVALTQPRPRLGDSAARVDETIRVDGHARRVSFGQDPWMEFPASNMQNVEWRFSSAVEEKSEAALRVEQDEPIPDKLHFVSRFLGMLGPQGALPLTTTEEVRGWLHSHDEAFAHFLDIFNNRFIQLFYRAWADARPIVQNDRPDFDRFGAYVRSMVGAGSEAFEDLPAVPQGVSQFAGLLAPAAKSASRLRGAIRGIFKVEVEIDQLVGSWLEFDKSELSLVGGRNSALGVDLLIGAASFSVQDKFRVRIFVADMKQYERFLPVGEDCRRLADLVFFYAGDELDWDVELALPAEYAQPMQLGANGRLGWTTWMAPNYESGTYRCDAKFQPAERLRRERDTGIKGGMAA